MLRQKLESDMSLFLSQKISAWTCCPFMILLFVPFVCIFSFFFDKKSAFSSSSQCFSALLSQAILSPNHMPPLHSSSLGRGAPLIVPVPLPCFLGYLSLVFDNFFTFHVCSWRNMAMSPLENLTPHSTSFKVLVVYTMHAFFRVKKKCLNNNPESANILWNRSK